MDWTYARFRRDQRFEHEPADVLTAARTYVAGTLGWGIDEERPGGFVASGSSFMHAAKATFAVTPDGAGARLSVDLAVHRASAFGFMLFDAGGYYNGQLQRWLEGVALSLAQTQGAAGPVTQPRGATAKAFDGCMTAVIVVFLLFAVIQFVIMPVFALFTGTLWLIGRGDAQMELHGWWARGVSAALLLLSGWIAWRMWRFTRKPTLSSRP